MIRQEAEKERDGGRRTGRRRRVRRPRLDRRARPPLTPGRRRGLLRTLVENTSEEILTINAESTILFANPAVKGILGYEPAELVGSIKLEIIPDRLQEVHERRRQRYVETGERNIDWGGVKLPARH